ncbi:MAG: hypothetical protein JSU65_06335 [Candidatus Zixiibacteriota bacterium]|nr:MAG: hypothetical protein JSU65_06335 [candidate division Zixibacteria bacterium]
MRKPDNRLLFLALTVLAVTLFYSCDKGFLSQPDDVFQPAEQTTVWLRAERLPTPPPGMIYELWVSSIDPATGGAEASQFTSLGKFSFLESDTLIAFLDMTGAVRADSNQFSLEADLWSFTHMFVSLELVSDADPDLPGPIMLMDRIVKLEDFSPELVFPLSDDLWNATVRYNMEAVSDNNYSANDGEGLWFSSYRRVRDTLPDTNGLDLTYDSTLIPIELDIDTLYDTTIDTTVIPPETTITTTIDTGDTLNLAELYAPYPSEIVNVDTVTDSVLYGPDSLLIGVDTVMHTHITYDIDSAIDSTPPFYKAAIGFTWNADPLGGDPNDIYSIDIYTQDDFGLPDLSAYGWKYEGWAVSTNIDRSITGTYLTPPAWRYKTAQVNWIPGDTSGMVSTGVFTKIDSADLEDPFTYRVLAGVRQVYDTVDPIEPKVDTIQDSIFRRPRYPGEDFLDPAALFQAYGLNSVVLDGGTGTAFISIEPDNRLTRKTNFPLIAFAERLPEVWFDDVGEARHINMFNMTSAVVGEIGWGFPEIVVTYERK